MSGLSRAEYVVTITPVPMAWKTENGWKIPKDFCRDQMEFNQPGHVEFGWKISKNSFCDQMEFNQPGFVESAGAPHRYEAATCRITDRDDARKTYDALVHVVWDNLLLSVTLTKHYVQQGQSKHPETIAEHQATRDGPKKFYESFTYNQRREPFVGNPPHRRSSSVLSSSRGERSPSRLYRRVTTPREFFPINPHNHTSLPSASARRPPPGPHSRQTGHNQFQFAEPSGLSSISYPAPAHHPPLPPIHQLRLYPSDDRGPHPGPRPGPESHRRTESISSNRTSHSDRDRDRDGPLILTSPGPD